MPQASVTSDCAVWLEGAIDTLLWCREHLEERKAAEALRDLELRLAAVALALDYEMEGEAAKARSANRRADPAGVWDWPTQAELEGC